ncbi:metallophosphoesterase family protein [Methylocella tundrae]|uniref:Calcineurin-like phosphoesterase domain-containing protein n=1 Tax=Methylocella tundrae TaxID=227605 RepID=A0A4V6IMQ9_METTU|nr:metallophosphoesterase [Methylocella tundrae]WPP03455.1 metallophosphoesterase [Methylocella tundrae]VFU09541.1 conserved protein of unknown function [Methylocella tundrae]
MTLRIIHLSDPHFGCENAAAVEAAIASANAYAPDLTIISGDLTSNGRSLQFKAASLWLKRLPQPQIVTPGNHDVPYWNLALRFFAPFSRYRRFIGEPLKTTADLPGLTVRSLNTARGAQPRLDWSKGAINLAAVEAAAQMQTSTTTLKVLVCHHPLLDPFAGTNTAAVTGAVHRGGAAARVLAEAGVDLILSGHVHNPFVFALPFAQGRSYAIGAGTLSRRTRGRAAGFSVIEADAETIKVTAMEWSGSQFHPATVWRLPRRTEAAQAEALHINGAALPICGEK